MISTTNFVHIVTYVNKTATLLNSKKLIFFPYKKDEQKYIKPESKVVHMENANYLAFDSTIYNRYTLHDTEYNI